MYLTEIPEIDQLVKDEKLYKMLVQQVNKDFVLAGVDYISFSEKIDLNEFIDLLSKAVENLFQGRYDSYLNFVYRVDVEEKDIVSLDSTSKTFYKDLARVLLKRELQKVWIRSRF